MCGKHQEIRTKDSQGDIKWQSWHTSDLVLSSEEPILCTATVPGNTHSSTMCPPHPHPYQALDDFQELLHDHSNALVAQQSADGLEVRGAHEVPVRAVDVAVGNVERLETEIEENECGTPKRKLGGVLAGTLLTEETESCCSQGSLIGPGVRCGQ